MAEPGTLSEKPPAAMPAAAAPRIWLLLGNRAGDRAQVEALGAAAGAALGWGWVAKRIVANALFRMPNLVLESSLLSIDRRASAPLSPPWPDLVIAAGRRTVPACRWIQRQSGGRTRLVHVGRPWAPLDWFDLVVSTPQYALPARPNLLLNALPLSRLDRARLAAAATEWAPRLEALPRPWTAVLVGGGARPYVLDADAAARLAAAASRAAGGGSLLVATSPRTPAAAAEILRHGLTASCRFHRWEAGAVNPYPAFLALADRLVVTGDSASMIGEACAAATHSGATVRIFDLPERPDLRLRAIRLLARRARPGGLFDRLVARGLITSVRDMPRLHARLYADGLAAPFDPAEPPPARAAAPGARERAGREMAATVARIHALFDPAETHHRRSAT